MAETRIREWAITQHNIITAYRFNDEDEAWENRARMIDGIESRASTIHVIEVEPGTDNEIDEDGQ